MRSFVYFFFFLLAILSVSAQYDSGDSSESSASLEIIDPDEGVIIEEGSGSGDGPIASFEQIHIFGILPGPGDIRKKRSIMDVLSRK